MLARGTLRGVFRSARPPAQLYRNQIRLASEDRPKRIPASSPRLLAGLAGAALLFVAGYNHYSNSKSIDSAASSAKSQLDKLSQDIPSSAPESNQAIPWLQSTATAYAVFIPEQKPFLDSVFNDLEVVQQKHGKRVDEIIQIAYQELKDATKNGLDFESVGNAWGVLEKAINQIGNLDAEPTNDVQRQHPDMQEKVGEKLDQLKKMAEDYGPEARKELEDVYQRMEDVLGGGLGSESAEKIRKLIQEKIQTVEKFGDVAWERGLEEVKPYSDKNPEIRVILLENRENLKHGNLEELWDKVRVAAQSGNTEELQKHVKEQEKRGRSG